MVLAAPVVLTRQAVTVSAAGGELRVQAPTATFIGGPVLERLRDGRSVPIEIELAVLDRSNGPALARARMTFTLSFDLWEERVAVRSAGKPPRSVSHLRPGEAEAWCIRNVTVPLSELARLGRNAPFWVAVRYRVVSDDPAPEEPSAFNLGRLIDALSRRGGPADFVKSVEGGPFRLPN